MKWLAKRRLNALDELVTGHKPKEWRLGLCFIHTSTRRLALGYRNKGGFGYRWMPEWLMRSIVKVWNPVTCRIEGHDKLDQKALGMGNKIVCVNCSKEWPTS